MEAFNYSIHLFLGIVGAFTLIALWNPRVLYHPKDIERYQESLKEKKYANITITIILFSLLILYAVRENNKLEDKQNTITHIAKELTEAISTNKKIRFICEQNSQNKNQVNILECQIMTGQ